MHSRTYSSSFVCFQLFFHLLSHTKSDCWLINNHVTTGLNEMHFPWPLFIKKTLLPLPVEKLKSETLLGNFQSFRLSRESRTTGPVCTSLKIFYLSFKELLHNPRSSNALDSTMWYSIDTAHGPLWAWIVFYSLCIDRNFPFSAEQVLTK